MLTRKHLLVGLFALAILALAAVACGLPATQAVPPAPAGDGQGTAPGCDFQTDDFINIAGTYAVEGGTGDPTGPTYSGEATITQLDRNCFSIEWRIDGRVRTGTITMVGNIVGGQWQEGSETGTLGGTVSDDGSITIGIERETGEFNDDFIERLTRR